MTNHFDPMIAANNIKRVEAYLGHRIPASLIDVEELGNKSMSMSEVQEYAMKIRQVEFFMGNKNKSEGINIIDAIAMIITVVAVVVALILS